MLTALPAPFLDRLAQILPPDRYPACRATFSSPAATAFRLNPLQGEPQETLAQLHAEGFTLNQLDWPDDAFSVPADQRRALTDSPACRQGRLYIQTPSSMIPPLLLAPRPDEWILDLAAAPGGKTIHLAGLMGNQGRISAVEAVRKRFFRLRTNLETHGVANTSTYLKDGTRVWRVCPEQFDRVLVDAPCTGEGRFHTDDPRTFAYWSNHKIRQMVRKQQRLLFSAVHSLRPGGVLVYSTCTFAPEENEGVIDRLLRRFDGALSVEPISLPLDNAQAGLSQWNDRPLHPHLNRARRILPDGLWEGFFVCRLKKERSTLEKD
ncbi:MAG: RsmB/NOP family class I SAM-dependent RNA methyltransferase [Candidatus Latescibacteria bacterium]|nr:RsmB/NOP family class I SAM-dependent RNA methyltransferase [Candidatus Latescibacterota bacterium]